MRKVTSLLPALAALLLLTACGYEQAGASGAAAPASGTAVNAPPVDGVRITSVTIPSATPTPNSDGFSVHADPLHTGDSGISAVYEVTSAAAGNVCPSRSGVRCVLSACRPEALVLDVLGLSSGAARVRAGRRDGANVACRGTSNGTEAVTYTILFDFTTDTGEVMGNSHETVRSVGPGATERGTVRLGVLAPGAFRVTRVKVSRVTKVPAAEAPPASGECPPSGIRLTTDDGDAAMGLRVVGLHLENCGKRDYSLDGYPLLELLDEDLSPVQGIRIVHGSGGISTGTGFDEPARPLVLKPGESAFSGLMWRNTTESGAAVNVPYVRVRAEQGADPVTVTPHLDLGTTGRLAVRAWTRPSK